MKSAAEVGVKTYHEGVWMVNELMTTAHSWEKFTCSPRRRFSLAEIGIVSVEIETNSVAGGGNFVTHLEEAAYVEGMQTVPGGNFGRTWLCLSPGLPQVTFSVVWICTATDGWSCLITNCSKTMGRNNKVCFIRLFHSCSFIYRMVKQKGGRRPPLADDRTDLIEKVDMVNERFFSYYRAQSIIPEEEWQSFLETIRSHLPTTFRVAGSRQCVRIVGWWWQSLMQTERPIPSILPFATYTYPHWVM